MAQSWELDPKNSKPEALAAKIRHALAGNQAVSACSSPSLGDSNKNGLTGPHLYTVVDVEKRHGIPMVKLRNPWGGFEPKHQDFKGGDIGDGVFWMPVSTFIRNFGLVTANPTGPRGSGDASAV